MDTLVRTLTGKTTVCALAFVWMAALAVADDQELKSLMRSSSTFDRGSPMNATVEAVITGKEGSTSTMKYSMYTVRADGLISVMIAFHAPDSYKGTRILTSVPMAGGKPSVSLKLNSFFAPIKVPLSTSGISFFGMDFAAGDMNPRNPDFDSYTVLEERHHSDGSTILVVEAVPLKEKLYDRIVHFVDKDKALITRSEMYDKDNRLVKVLEALDISLVDGVWSALTLRMSTVKDGTSTVMRYTDLHYGQNMTAYVNESFLKNGRPTTP